MQTMQADEHIAFMEARTASRMRAAEKANKQAVGQEMEEVLFGIGHC